MKQRKTSKKARERYPNRSEKEKEKKKKYGGNQIRLAEYRKNYFKMSKNINFKDIS